jgi:hypothetical protein
VILVNIKGPFEGIIVMNLKTSSALLLMILLASCATASPAPEIFSPTPLSTLTPTATSAPSKTPTPKPTETNTASPTPEITLVGLIPQWKDFPAPISADEEAQHIQKAKDTKSLYQEPGDPYSIQLSSSHYSDNLFIGDDIRIGCNIEMSCLIRASYQTIAKNGMPIHKLLLELYVTFADNTQGSVIVPIISDQGYYDSTGTAVENQFLQGRLNVLAQNNKHGGVIQGIFIVSGMADNSPKPANPVVQFLLDSAFHDEATKALLAHANDLAKEGKFLTQAEIDELHAQDATIWY